MSAKRKARGADSAAPASPKPALTVTATVSVSLDGEGDIVHRTRVEFEGVGVLVDLLRERADEPLAAAGHLLRDVVLAALAHQGNGPSVVLTAREARPAPEPFVKLDSRGGHA